MSRKVFFSFHFDRDVWRAAQIRNSDLLADEDEYGVIDAVEWEKLEREGDDAIRRWINDQLKYTSVTAVLIGSETSERDWVAYEIQRSWERGNGLVGVRIHNMKDRKSRTDSAGRNPLDGILANGKPLSSIFKTYDWVANDGRTNLGQWVEEAYQISAARKGENALKITDDLQRPQHGTGPTVITNPARPWST